MLRSDKENNVVVCFNYLYLLPFIRLKSHSNYTTYMRRHVLRGHRSQMSTKGQHTLMLYIKVSECSVTSNPLKYIDPLTHLASHDQLDRAQRA